MTTTTQQDLTISRAELAYIAAALLVAKSANQRAWDEMQHNCNADACRANGSAREAIHQALTAVERLHPDVRANRMDYEVVSFDQIGHADEVKGWLSDLVSDAETVRRHHAEGDPVHAGIAAAETAQLACMLQRWFEQRGGRR